MNIRLNLLIICAIIICSCQKEQVPTNYEVMLEMPALTVDGASQTLTTDYQFQFRENDRRGKLLDAKEHRMENQYEKFTLTAVSGTEYITVYIKTNQTVTYKDGVTEPALLNSSEAYVAKAFMLKKGLKIKIYADTPTCNDEPSKDDTEYPDKTTTDPTSSHYGF